MEFVCVAQQLTLNAGILLFSFYSSIDLYCQLLIKYHRASAQIKRLMEV